MNIFRLETLLNQLFFLSLWHIINLKHLDMNYLKIISYAVSTVFLCACTNTTNPLSINTNAEFDVGTMAIRILIVVVTVIAAFAIIEFTKRANAKEDGIQKRERQAEERLLLQKKDDEARKRNKDREYEANYGVCAKVIPNPSDPNSDLIRVYEKSSVILIKGMKYGFDEIIGWDLIDNSKVIKGELSSTTSTNNVNAIGRAVMGAALGGVAGAVIGGTTAKQTTEYKQGEDKTIHDYTLNIKVNRLSEPLVKLYVGKNEDLALEAAALINIIVLRNKDGYDKFL